MDKDFFDVPEGLWKRIEPLVPQERPKPRGGRPRVPDRVAMAGILHRVRTGCPPHSRSPPLSSALDAAPDRRPRTPLPAPCPPPHGGAGQRAIAMPPLPFTPSTWPLRIRRQVHGGARGSPNLVGRLLPHRRWR